MTYIRQCELRSVADTGENVTVSWLPEKVAVIGNKLTFRDDTRIWTVTAVYERIEEDHLSRRHHSLVI